MALSESPWFPDVSGGIHYDPITPTHPFECQSKHARIYPLNPNLSNSILGVRILHKCTIGANCFLLCVRALGLVMSLLSTLKTGNLCHGCVLPISRKVCSITLQWFVRVVGLPVASFFIHKSSDHVLTGRLGSVGGIKCYNKIFIWEWHPYIRMRMRSSSETLTPISLRQKAVWQTLAIQLDIGWSSAFKSHRNLQCNVILNANPHAWWIVLRCSQICTGYGFHKCGNWALSTCKTSSACASACFWTNAFTGVELSLPVGLIFSLFTISHNYSLISLFSIICNQVQPQQLQLIIQCLALTATISEYGELSIHNRFNQEGIRE